MANDPAKTRRRHVREKSVINHVARELFAPKPEPAAENGTEHPGPTTDTGLSVEEQVRKEWDPSKGGLPIFFAVAAHRPGSGAGGGAGTKAY
jgi:hypothetical protein